MRTATAWHNEYLLYRRQRSGGKGTLKSYSLGKAMYTLMCRLITCELEGGQMLVWSPIAAFCYPENYFLIRDTSY